MIAVKDEIDGEEVAAWIVPDREVSDPKQMASDLHKFAEGKKAHYKLPRYIYLTEQFPITANGNVHRKNASNNQPVTRRKISVTDRVFTSQEQTEVI